jgi:hypothetical protein
MKLFLTTILIAISTFMSCSNYTSPSVRKAFANGAINACKILALHFKDEELGMPADRYCEYAEATGALVESIASLAEDLANKNDPNSCTCPEDINTEDP